MSINVERLEQFVEALAQVIESDPEAHEVDMGSGLPPACGTPGCHAGLAMLALNRIGVEGVPDEYDYGDESRRLSVWLLETPFTGLRAWASGNQALWGNPHGSSMFSDPIAFGQKKARFPAAVIRDHWRGVLARVKAAQLTEA